MRVDAEITELLRQHHAGDRAAFDRLLPQVYAQLRQIARRQLQRFGATPTLQATELVQEAYLQLVEESGVAWQDRGHFFAVCARAMRRILVDAARRRGALKRGGDQQLEELLPDSGSVEAISTHVLALDSALGQLQQINPRLVALIECRYFAGMSEPEAALALNVPLRTLQRDWLRARVWLQRALG
ncbi:MAG: sigma-70 family RNA polymerase sigma factor [Xanthomonadales bacterium]|nr:sigma-70 family RNA polymerase sigma factor [Xanthomonadales bacterium]